MTTTLEPESTLETRAQAERDIVWTASMIAAFLEDCVDRSDGLYGNFDASHVECHTCRAYRADAHRYLGNQAKGSTALSEDYKALIKSVEIADILANSNAPDVGTFTGEPRGLLRDREGNLYPYNTSGDLYLEDAHRYLGNQAKGSEDLRQDYKARIKSVEIADILANTNTGVGWLLRDRQGNLYPHDSSGDLYLEDAHRYLALDLGAKIDQVLQPELSAEMTIDRLQAELRTAQARNRTQANDISRQKEQIAIASWEHYKAQVGSPCTEGFNAWLDAAGLEWPEVDQDVHISGPVEVTVTVTLHAQDLEHNREGRIGRVDVSTEEAQEIMEEWATDAIEDLVDFGGQSYDVQSAECASRPTIVDAETGDEI